MQDIDIDVDFVEHSPGAPFSGIGRYTRELHRHLADRVSVRLTTQVDPSLVRYSSFFHNVPLGVKDRRPGSLVHFMEDLGCSQMLWKPVVPAVATSHDLGMLVWPPESEMHRPLDRLVWRLSYLGLRRMDAVIAVSEFSRRMLMKHLRIPGHRVVTIHPGIERSTFRPVPGAREQLAARHGLPNGERDRYLLYVGTEIPRKNLPTIFSILTRLPPSVRLLKIGSAGHQRFRRSTQETIQRLQLSDRVIVLDEVSEEELPLIYSAADVYVCSSILEGFCLPVLEAMACGTPVVCSNAASLPEVTGGAAVLLPPTDVDGFVAAVTSILGDDELCKHLRKRGLQRAADFSWEKSADEAIRVYQRVLAVRAGKARTVAEI